MPEVGTDPEPQVGRHGVTLRQDVLQVHVRRDVTPRDAPQADRIVTRGVDHDASQTLLETRARLGAEVGLVRSEEHTSELQSRRDLVCRLLLEKKKKKKKK